MKVCAHPGCPTLTETSWCATHAPATTGRPGTTRYLTDQRWRRLSIAYRRKNPVCEACGQARASDVNHKDGQGLDGPQAYDWHNLEALCHPCHSKTTATQGTRAARGLPKGRGTTPKPKETAARAVANLGQIPPRVPPTPRAGQL